MKRRYLRKPIQIVLEIIAAILTIMIVSLDDFDLTFTAIAIIFGSMALDAGIIAILTGYGRYEN